MAKLLECLLFALFPTEDPVEPLEELPEVPLEEPLGELPDEPLEEPLEDPLKGVVEPEP